MPRLISELASGPRAEVARPPAATETLSLVPPPLARPTAAPTLDDLASSIRGHHERALHAFREGVSEAISCGARLIEAKAQVKRGEWLPWIAKNFEFTPQTANGYMRLARHAEQIEGAPSISSALKQLAASPGNADGCGEQKSLEQVWADIKRREPQPQEFPPKGDTELDRVAASLRYHLACRDHYEDRQLDYHRGIISRAPELAAQDHEVAGAMVALAFKYISFHEANRRAETSHDEFETQFAMARTAYLAYRFAGWEMDDAIGRPRKDAQTFLDVFYDALKPLGAWLDAHPRTNANDDT